MTGGWRPNPVQMTLTLAIVVGLTTLAFVTQAPNRLTTGSPIMVWQLPGHLSAAAMGLLVALLCLTSALPASRPLAAIGALVSAALVILTVFTAGQTAQSLAALHPPAARTGLGSAFWITEIAAALALLDCLKQMDLRFPARLTALLALVCIVAVMAAIGVLDHLSIVREYFSRRAAFSSEILRHILLVVSSLVPALVIGVPLGLAAARKPVFGRYLLSILSFVQTVPSVALFGLLIVPLSALGLSGVGTIPAVLALIAYSLLPIVRTTQTGLASIDPGVLESARGLGFSRDRILLTIEVPLAIPVLLAGLRFVVVQAIGLAVIAALVGAGGLGTFVFQGIAQYATDLVMLGSLAVIALALTADGLFQLLRRIA